MTRPFDKHLDSDELDGLVSLHAAGVPESARLSEQVLGEAQRHVESCQACSRKVQMHRSVQSEMSRLGAPNQQPGPKCISDAEWLNAAAGLLPEAKTIELMKHAAQCGRCGPLLREAAETLADEATPSEETLLASLSSAQPKWQREMAKTLRSSNQDQLLRNKETSWKQGLFWWSHPAFAVAMLAAVVVAGWLGSHVLRPPSAEQLLAQAYTEHRALEVRIPGAKFAPMRVERGPGGSNIDKPSSLLKAEALIGENLTKHPSDPAWLQAKARADLLDGNYESAIQSLQRALETRPDSPQLLIDLASAYFARAESAARPIDYGNAVDSLGRALAKTPDDPVALFNRAIISERIFLYTQAVDDWEHYLRVDPQGAWADDARRRLATLREKLQQHDHSQSEALLSPSEIAGSGQDPVIRGKIDERAEDYLHLAVVDWLPKAYPASLQTVGTTTVFRSALTLLADITAEKHGDSWLADLLSAKSSPRFSSALAALAQSIKAGDHGDFASAEASAAEAERAFSAADNVAGTQLARYERVYALHQAQEGGSCLRVAAGLPKNIGGSRYRWLRIQVRLEEGTCDWIVGDLGSARRLYLLALHDAETSGYPSVYLRAVNHAAGIDSASGNELSAWSQAQRGLALYWSGKIPPMQGYNLYFVLHEVADWTHRPYLDVGVWRQAVATIDSSPDIVLRAAAHSYLGNAAAAADMPEFAERELLAASRIFATAPQDQPTRIARIEAETRLADLEVLLGRISRAYERLSALQPEVSSISDNLLALIFYRALGEARFQQGALKEADAALRAAISLAELNLKSLQGEETRLRWAAEARGAYRTLSQLRLRTGDSQDALEIWEWYRGAALRSGKRPTLASMPSPQELAEGPALPRPDEVASHLPILTGETVVSYAVFNEGVEVWTFDNRGVSAHWISIPAKHLGQLVHQFRTLCADSSSDLDYLRHDARQLYDLLIAPVEPALDLKRTLVVEADDVLNDLPFEALLDTHDQYLADRVSMVSSLGLYYRDLLRPESILSADTPALIAAVAAPGMSEDDPIPAVTDAENEARTIAAGFQLPILLQGRDANSAKLLARLRGARIFHFAGHAITSTSRAGLLLSDGLLSVASVRSADLSGLQLAVLSACETERGTSESPVDPDSFVRSFLRAGVPHVVASRWRVDSAATQVFMQTFYRALLSGGAVANSVRISELALRAHPGMSHPYYWAAFHGFGRI